MRVRHRHQWLRVQGRADEYQCGTCPATAVMTDRGLVERHYSGKGTRQPRFNVNKERG